MIGKPEGWGKEQQENFEKTDYHQPSDQLRPEWDFSGAVEDAQLCFYLGAKVANDPKLPTWNPGRRVRGGAEEGARVTEVARPFSRRETSALHLRAIARATGDFCHKDL